MVVGHAGVTPAEVSPQLPPPALPFRTALPLPIALLPHPITLPMCSLGHGYSHTRRLSDISRTIVDDQVPAPPRLPELDAAVVADAPPYLRGHVLRMWALKREAGQRVMYVIEGG